MQLYRYYSSSDYCKAVKSISYIRGTCGCTASPGFMRAVQQCACVRGVLLPGVRASARVLLVFFFLLGSRESCPTTKRNKQQLAPSPSGTCIIPFATPPPSPFLSSADTTPGKFLFLQFFLSVRNDPQKLGNKNEMCRHVDGIFSVTCEVRRAG